ncbi:MAG: tetratricopeptide repeat protein [Gammaproteobacteria bacterium]|nr:tetratricopeptide repeat protein [Gammaproteobacteria bacterium]
MNKSKLDLQTIHQFHHAGLLDAAKEGYIAILEDEPDNAEILLALGILLAQQGNFPASINTLRAAIEYEPANPILFLNLGNALKSAGLFTEATEAFHQAIDISPDYPAALNNLGTVYYAQNNFSEAIKYYRLAIEKKPDYLDAFYNLALALTKNQQIQEAIRVYESITAMGPTYTAAYFQLGCLYLELNQIQKAITCFQTVEQGHPQQFETQSNLATCYLKLGLLNQARTHYTNALALSPDDTQILFNLGVINMQQGHIEGAIQNYQRVIQLNPDFFAAHNNLGVAFLAKNLRGYALHHFREALRLQPHNEAISYTVQMLVQDQQLLTSPPGYIQNLFDSYADHYEPHLLNTLDYKIPELLFEAVQTIMHLEPKSLDILDLGCGTGLCGLSFESFAKTLTGIDLSPKMLTLAAQKNIYTELIANDLLAGLRQKTHAYDLIIAGDVFVYIGDLKPIFQAVTQALRPEGLFAFNTEITEKADFTLNQSGRFSHQKKYLEQLAAENGYQIVYYQRGITRQQNNEPVYGHLYILKLSPDNEQ